jgi:hypothetical protein
MATYNIDLGWIPAGGCFKVVVILLFRRPVPRVLFPFKICFFRPSRPCVLGGRPFVRKVYPKTAAPVIQDTDANSGSQNPRSWAVCSCPGCVFLGLNDNNNTDMEGEKSHQKCEGPGENSWINKLLVGFSILRTHHYKRPWQHINLQWLLI